MGDLSPALGRALGHEAGHGAQAGWGGLVFGGPSFRSFQNIFARDGSVGACANDLRDVDAFFFGEAAGFGRDLWRLESLTLCRGRLRPPWSLIC